MRAIEGWFLLCLLSGCSASSTGAEGPSPGGTGGAAWETGGAGGAFGGMFNAGAGGDPGTGGTLGGSGSDGAGGTVVIPHADAGTPYDPSITFDWPETKPLAGACEAGTYVGSFTCEIAFIPGFPPGQVTGPVTFSLTPSANGEFLEIKDGKLTATAQGSVPFGCDLLGQLDCGTRKFHADAQNGTYGTAPFTGTFFGNMEGTLDGVTSTLSGTWALTPGTMAAPAGGACQGNWSAVKTP